MSALTDALQVALHVADNEGQLSVEQYHLIKEHIDSLLLLHLANQPADGVAIPAEPAALFNTPTGRVYKPEPEIQNLPGTPAAKLEMAYATYGRGAISQATADAIKHGTGVMVGGEHVPLAEVLKPVISFPCQIKFTIYPYKGEVRSAVWLCPYQADVDRLVDFCMSDETGNTERVVYSVYVKPEVKP